MERMSEVYQQIVDTGTYRQTTEELEYGVKTAWRNASRCIGRIQWSKLKVQQEFLPLAYPGPSA